MSRLIPVLLFTLVACGCERRSEVSFSIYRRHVHDAYLVGCSYDLNTFIKTAESRSFWEKAVAPRFGRDAANAELIRSSMKIAHLGGSQTPDAVKFSFTISAKGNGDDAIEALHALLDALAELIASSQPQFKKSSLPDDQSVMSYDLVTGDRERLYVYLEY